VIQKLILGAQVCLG